jgi:hypothetical protein
VAPRSVSPWFLSAIPSQLSDFPAQTLTRHAHR